MSQEHYYEVHFEWIRSSTGVPSSPVLKKARNRMHYYQFYKVSYKHGKHHCVTKVAVSGKSTSEICITKLKTYHNEH